MRRVAITGIGVVSSIGHNASQFWESLRTGVSGFGPLTGVLRGTPRMPWAAQVKGFDPLQHFDGKSSEFLDRFAQLGTVAAREAVRDSGIVFSPEQTVIATGSSMGGKYIEDDGYFQMYAENGHRFHPLTIAKAMHNGLTSHLSMEMQLTGPGWTVSTACASANHAIGQAFWMVRNGSAEAALVGGAEAPFTMGIIRAWEAMRVCATDTCRPFSKDRKGLVLGEGAAMLVLEPLEAAVARGAFVYAELCGFGMSADAHHITQPSAQGAARAMRAALRDAGLMPDSIDYINAHGTGTAANDVTETAGIHEVFGEHAARLAISSTKSMHGHTLGAAGALEAVATMLTMRHGVIPATQNYLGPDPACDLDYVTEGARPRAIGAALSNSFAFGGLNAVLAFRSV